jgi:hypothetical protein
VTHRLLCLAPTTTRYRSAHMLFTLTMRLRKHRARLGDFHAWNKCLNHIIALANAHVEATVYDAFSKAVTACIDPDCRWGAGQACCLWNDGRAVTGQGMRCPARVK